MLTIIVLALFGFIFLVDCRPTLKTVQRKEKIWYLSIMSISFAILILYSLDIQIPSPSVGITNVLVSLFPQIK